MQGLTRTLTHIDIFQKAHRTFALEEHDAEVGGGSLPGLKLQTIAISIGHRSINEYDIAVSLRTGTIPVVPRIQKERVLIDLRSVQPEEDGLLSVAVQQVIQ